MRVVDPALARALCLSILLHALLFAGGSWVHDPVRRTFATPAARLDVTLQPLSAMARLQPPLLLDDAPQPAVRPAQRALSAPLPAARAHRTSAAAQAIFAVNSGAALAGEAARQANAQLARELFYPPEAIARGLEGQTLVLLFLDASGNAIAARVEASSGHALLDDAALRAAKTLRTLPDNAPREALLPVRFRLR